ncbi:MAG: DMT family transporter [Bacteroidales bacterium]
MKNQTRAYLLALLAVFFWSTIASAFKLTLRYVSFIELLFWASLTSLGVFSLFLGLKGKLSSIFKHPRKQIILAALAGILNPLAYYLILLKAYELLPAQEAGTLNYFWPVVLVVLSIPLLHQKIRLSNIAAVVVSFAGIVIISTHGDPASLHFSNPKGVALALTTPFIWALYWIINMKNPLPDTLKLFMGFLTAFPFLLIIYVLNAAESPLPVWQGLVGSIYVGLFEMGITFLIWLNALQKSETTAHISNFVFLSPFLSLIYIHFLVGEEILPSTIGGLALVIAGIFIHHYAGNIYRFFLQKTLP